ncbi:MAG: bifunctional glutamate N-acetyltransferase/amino-acid acetyltransferase ArgJ [Pirellulaceae bacterium]|nr:bifunctional glutamate N-acetyltransferase/amino-acid acetyltransferase ArgJ [Pirellulaceae bacterium]
MPLPAVPQGFRLAAASCGIKSTPDREDVTLIVCDDDAVAAGVYTTNLVHASSVAVNRQKTPFGRCRVVVVNSGNANTCTGKRGERDSLEMLSLAAESCGAAPHQALVMSTGIIGVFLPMEKVRTGITTAAARLARDENALAAAARGFTTTDKYEKVAGRTIEVAGTTIQITGIAKGAGMIAPNMATLLATIMTDARLTPSDAQTALQAATNVSFNSISVDGHMSTSDTVLLLASGKSSPVPLGEDDLALFQTALDEVCVELARMIPADGEGASHLITLDVSGCRTREEAHQIAKQVAESALVKTAVTGADPNWGRIVSAAGQAGVPFDPAGMSLSMNGRAIFQHGEPVAFDAADVSRSIRNQQETHVELSFTEGSACTRFWASDLTVDYVVFNSEYTT